MAGRAGGWMRACALIVVVLLPTHAHADEAAGPAEVDAVVQRLTAARTAKDATAAAAAVAPTSELLPRLADPKLRARLLTAVGSLLREPGLAGAHRATVRELLEIEDPAAYQQLRPHLPQPKDEALGGLGAEILGALAEIPRDGALKQLKELASSARAPDVKAAALRALGGYGTSPERVSVLEFLLQEAVRGRPAPPARPRWSWVTEWQRTAPLLLAALQRLTGRQDNDLRAWVSRLDQGRGALPALFERDSPLPSPPPRPGTPWQRARAALGTPTTAIRTAVDRALRWLAAHQSPDGAFRAAEFTQWCDGAAAPRDGPTGPGNPAFDVGLTGLALNAFLVAGYAGAGDHPYDRAVARALAWLVSTQDAEGVFGSRSVRGGPQIQMWGSGPAGSRRSPIGVRQGVTTGDGVHVYNQALAVLALVEAYGLRGEPELRHRAQRGLDWIHAARNPYVAWRYGKVPGDNDTSVTVWMALVLCCARLVNAAHLQECDAAPFHVDEAAFDGVRLWFDKMTDPDEGRVGYATRGTPPSRPEALWEKFPEHLSEAPTAGAMYIRMLMGEDPRKSTEISKGALLCAKRRPAWTPSDGSIDMIYWHFGTLATHRLGGRDGELWTRDLQAALLGSQRRDGNACGELGSWDPSDPWGREGGRVYATAINALTLLTPWRLPGWGM